MRHYLIGIFSSLALLTIYFSVLSLVSGAPFAFSQFKSFWYFILALAFGFGIQVGLFSYAKDKVSRSTLGVTGTTSVGSMISCCSHYLATILPVIGTTGIVSIIAGYQVQIFWVGILANLTGIFYIGRKVYILNKLQ